MALLNLLLTAVFAALGIFDAGGTTAAGGSGGEGGKDGDPGTRGGGSGGEGSGATDPPAGSGGQGAGAAAGAGAGAAATGPASTQPAAAGQAPAQQGTRLEDVEKLQRELNDVRAEAGRYRTAGIQAVAAALGIELPKGKGEDGDKAAITQLQTEVNSLRSEARTGAIEVGLERLFTKLGANPRVARPYIERQLKDLDPKAEDFPAKLEQIVQAAIDEEPALKAAQVARRSGGEFTGNGSTSTEELDPLKLAAQVPRT